MKQKLAFLGLFIIIAAETIINFSGEFWKIGLTLFAAIMGLMAATFMGWLNLPTFEKYATVPFVKLVRIFNHEPGHDQYLTQFEERKGGQNG